MLKRIGLAVALALAATLVMAYWCYRDVVIWPQVSQKVVALTFDDGPNPPHTRALLQVLQAHQVRATFFMKGANVEAFPDQVRAVAAAGHEIGGHSYHHRPMLGLRSAAYAQELELTNQLLAAELGYTPQLFRPPYGLQGVGLTLALRQLGLRSIGMGVHGSDWSQTDSEQISQSILAGIKPGAIILLHDGHADIADPHAQDSRAASVQATGQIITVLRSDGYRFVTVSELLELAALAAQ